MKDELQLEPEAKELVTQTANPPFLFDLGPEKGRAFLEELQSGPIAKPDLIVEDLSIDSGPTGHVSVRVMRPLHSRLAQPVILYIHGAGWVFGSAQTHDRLIRELAVRSQAAVVFPNYSLSPEAKYPVAIDECYAVAEWIAEHGQEWNLDPTRVAIAGDSVGGNMAAALTIMSQQRGGPTFERQLLFYPVTNADFETESYRQFATGHYLRRDAMMWFWDQYTSDPAERAEPTASPLRASLDDLRGLPAALIITAEADVLRDEGEAYADHLRAAGVSVIAARFQGTIHDFVMLNSLAQTAAARGAMALATTWLRLVDDLLEVSRITRGKIELRKERVDLAAIVSSAVETSRPAIDAAGHQLAISLPPQPMLLDADLVRLAQVIANLLNNAAKYTNQGGQIWLQVRQEGDEAIISVRDNGLGIPPPMLPRVFDMFAQADRNLSHSQGGLGIGLALAKSLVQMHGGRIEAHSAGPGTGSEFIVRLPLAEDTARPRPKSPAAPVPAPQCELPVRRILVVDDTRAAAYTLGRLLEAMGQQVKVVFDGAEAVYLARSERPDIVISDVAMPGVDGYQLAQRLRREPQLSDMVLVALTGYGQDSDRREALEAGFDYHLVKPVDFHALRDLLASLSGRRAPSAT